MAVTDAQNPLLDGNTCASLLNKLQEIWDEVGESDEERDKMLLQIEQECLDVYKRKVEQAAKARAQLLQSLSDAKLELSTLLSALGEKSFAPEKTSGTIKEQLASIAPTLEQLWKQKEERIKEFSDVQSQIQKICGEITGDMSTSQIESFEVDESDLSPKKLDEYQSQLQELQREKSERLHKVLEFVSTVHDLCAVLGMDFFSIVTEVHPSLNDSIGVHSKSISNGTLAKLAETVSTLKEDKKQRFYKDENRYNASRGAHLNLKRAEKARILVNKIPALVDTLVAKTRAWEEAHNMSFTYDGVPLLAMLDEYAMLRHEREEEKRRLRDQKKYQEQQTTEPEPAFGFRPSPAKPLGNKKVVSPRPNGGANGTPNRRLSLNAHQNGSKSTTKDGKRDNTRSVASLNNVSISKEDAASHVSGTEPVPASP